MLSKKIEILFSISKGLISFVRAYYQFIYIVSKKFQKKYIKTKNLCKKRF